MIKHVLMAPGPSMIPEKVLLEMAKPIIHHRTKEFEGVLASARAKLKKVFQTKNEVILHSSVGSGGMESCIVNFFSENDKVLVIRSGKFGERWSEQAKQFKLNVINLDVPWGQAFDIKKVKEILDSEKDIRGVFAQACETSTGTSQDIKSLGELVKNYDEALLFVDAITALGIYDIKTDDWGLDVVLTGSQKAFMLPPGLSMLSLSASAIARLETSTLPKYYFDIKQELKMQVKNQTHFTPVISLIQGLNVSLDMMLDEGLSEMFKRHKFLAHATQEGVKALGLKLFSEHPSHSITAVVAPSGIDGEKIVSHMFDKYGFTIIGGQDKLKGKVFRLGHMGYCSAFDVLGMLGALEMTLKDLGHSFHWGESLKKASEILHQGSI